MRESRRPSFGHLLTAFGLWACVFAWTPPAAAGALFGYKEVRQENLGLFPQWLDVLERHLLEDVPEGDCGEQRLNRCHLRDWFAFLEGIRGLPRTTQIHRVNEYANRKNYILDIDNYGMEDYWAIPNEFLRNAGDCEDYAITKLLSLRWLGIGTGFARIVVLQDTNLRMGHAVLAVYTNNDILILDNQVEMLIALARIVSPPCRACRNDPAYGRGSRSPSAPRPSRTRPGR